MSTHTLIVTLEPLSSTDAAEYYSMTAEDRKDWDRERLQVAIECTGVDQACHCWLECMNPHDFSEDDVDAGEGVAHGELHMQINSMWCVETGKCSLDRSFYDWWYESAHELAHQLGVGRWPVVHTWEDECILIERARELADARAS